MVENRDFFIRFLYWRPH